MINGRRMYFLASYDTPDKPNRYGLRKGNACARREIRLSQQLGTHLCEEKDIMYVCASYVMMTFVRNVYHTSMYRLHFTNEPFGKHLGYI